VDVPLPAHVTWGADNKATVYAAYRVRWQAVDSWGKQRQTNTIVYGTDDTSEALLLGMPSLMEERITLAPWADQWRFENLDFDIVKPKKFLKQLRSQAVVYALVVQGQTLDDLPGRVRIATVSTAMGEVQPYVPDDRVKDFIDVFNAPKHPIPCEGVQHEIQTTGDPPFGPLYNLSERELGALRDYLASALEKGWIRHSVSPAGAPILFVPKKDGGLRLCVDYRALNKVTVKNRMALPLISEILDRLTGKKFLSKLDLQDAYHRIPIAEGDRWKSAFRTRYGHFEYCVMPFGLTNAPATFQAYINKALAGLVDLICIVYLDDILIFSDSEEEHTKHVRAVLDRLRRYALYANPKKCSLFQREVDFLGYVVGADGIKMDQTRVDSIQDWPKPQSYSELQTFLGFVNFYRRFIEGYSHIARPLIDMLKGSKDGKKFGPWRWDPAAETAFSWLKEAFTKAPILAHFDPQRRIRVETDASKFAIAAILKQLQKDDQWHPIAFWSRKLIDAETRYDTHDQELLAIVAAFKQ
jgi:hypothetical protein